MGRGGSGGPAANNQGARSTRRLKLYPKLAREMLGLTERTRPDYIGEAPDGALAHSEARWRHWSLARGVTLAEPIVPDPEGMRTRRLHVSERGRLRFVLLEAGAGEYSELRCLEVKGA